MLLLTWFDGWYFIWWDSISRPHLIKQRISLDCPLAFIMFSILRGFICFKFLSNLFTFFFFFWDKLLEQARRQKYYWKGIKEYKTAAPRLDKTYETKPKLRTPQELIWRPLKRWEMWFHISYLKVLIEYPILLVSCLLL